MALLLKPDLLICDEPTTALDVTTQASILKLILELQKKNGTAVLFITHDFGVVSEIADQVVVLDSANRSKRDLPTRFCSIRKSRIPRSLSMRCRN